MIMFSLTENTKEVNAHKIEKVGKLRQNNINAGSACISRHSTDTVILFSYSHVHWQQAAVYYQRSRAAKEVDVQKSREKRIRVPMEVLTTASFPVCQKGKKRVMLADHWHRRP